MLIISDVSSSVKYDQSQRDLSLLRGIHANVSHDMRAPLSLINQAVDLIIDGKLIVNQDAIRLLMPVKTASQVLGC